MSCSHKKKAPICVWDWPRKKVGISGISSDRYEVYHCPSCNGVGVTTHNELVYSRGPISGSLAYSFERRGK